MLTELERKLLTLALDQAAQPGEWATAWMKLGQSLRERKVDSYSGELLSAQKPAPNPAMMKWPGTIVMGFGKHKGKMLAEIDPGYLQWAIANLDKDHDFYLIMAMEWLLEDLRNKKRHHC